MLSLPRSGESAVSQSKIDSKYQSVQEQTGLFAGKGGYQVEVDKHTQLDGSVIASSAEADKNRLSTGTLGWSDLKNEAEYKSQMQSASVSSGNGGADGFTSNMPSGMLIAYNHGGSASGTTSSAISNGTLDIRDPGQQKQDVATLSRDVEHANGSISPIFDKEKEQKRLRDVQLIGEIGTQVTDIVRTEGQLKADQEASKELEEKGIRRPGKNASKEDVENYQKQLIATDAYQQVMGKYGTGGDYQRAAQAVTAALQGLAGGDIGSALAGASAPYLANIIKRTVDDNDAARIMAQAVLGAVVAQVQGNSAAAGAAGAATGELIAAQLYPNRSRDQLTEAEKQTISALSSLAAGFVGGAVGGDFSGAVTGAQSGRNASENNELGSRAIAEKNYNDFAKQSCDGLPADICRSNYSKKLMGEGGNVLVGGVAIVGGAGAVVTLGPEILAACGLSPALCTELGLVAAELPFGAATAGGAALGVGGFGSIAAKEMAAAAEAASSAGASLPKNLNISSLDDIVDKAINPAVVLDSLLPYVRGGDTTSLSVATGAVEINGEVNYLLSVSGKSWKGDAPKTVEIGGSQYKVIVADSGVVPSVSNGANGSTNFNHAEQKIMSYLQ